MTETVDCFCDGCGKKTTCWYADDAPPGWFYLQILENGELLTTILACTEACKALNWTQQPLRAPKTRKKKA